jgi:hypothetical protein
VKIQVAQLWWEFSGLAGMAAAIVGVVNLVGFLRHRTILRQSFKTRLVDEHTFRLSTEAKQGYILFQIGILRASYVGKITVLAISKEETTDLLELTLRKSHLKRASSRYLPYDFRLPVTGMKICVDLQPGWNSAWVHRAGYYPELEDLRIVVREKRSGGVRKA